MSMRRRSDFGGDSFPGVAQGDPAGDSSGMISGFILAFTLSIDVFAVTIFTIGNEGLGNPIVPLFMRMPDETGD